ncbi:hypothetical protein CW714_03700 [Methanophagales archaeon]|nr:MAG: hypothetical protein CW714_03700 [Methanophagales archaeon]
MLRFTELESFEALFGTFLLVGIALTTVGVYALYKRNEKSGCRILSSEQCSKEIGLLSYWK